MKMHASPGALLGITVPDCEPSYVDACLKGLAQQKYLPPVINPWEHLNYFSAESLRRLLVEEGFSVISDFGSTAAASEACIKFGNPDTNSLVNSLRIFKRARMAAPSTQLFCMVL